MKSSTRLAGRLASPSARAAQTVSRTPRLSMLGWHRIGDAGDGLTTSFDDFRRHLDVLEEWGATVLSLDEAYRLRGLGQLPARATVLTFDDGYASIAEQAWPELKRRGLAATLYVVSGYLDDGLRFPWDHQHRPGSDLTRLINRSDLQHIVADGLDVGSHTVTHRWLPGLTPAEVAVEVHDSKAALEDLLQSPIRSFSYPMGGLTKSIREEVRRAGYEVAVTTERGSNSSSQNSLILRRAFAFDDPEDLRRQVTGAYTWMRLIEHTRRRREPQW